MRVRGGECESEGWSVRVRGGDRDKQTDRQAER